MATIDLSTTIKNSIQAFMDYVNTSIPGVIQKYDYKKKLATVLPSINHINSENRGFTMPILNSVPVIFPGTADSTIHFPLKKGDKVLIIFSQRSLERWITQDGSAQDPGDPRQFALQDAYCIPGLFTPKAPGKPVTGTGFEILHKDTKIVLQDDGSIELNGNGKRLVTWQELQTVLNTMVTALSTHTHPETGTTTSPSPALAALSGDITAAKTSTIKTGG